MSWLSAKYQFFRSKFFGASVGVLFVAVSVFDTSASEDYSTIEKAFLEVQSPLFESDLDLKTRKQILAARTEKTAFDQKLGYFVDTLDEENAYLLIRSVGDGSGTEFILTFWKRPGKSNLVGLVRTDWGTGVDDSKAAFFEKENGKWKEVTSKVFPKITHTHFIDKKHFDGIDQKVIDDPTLLITLPKKGKDISVSLDLYNLEEYLNGSKRLDAIVEKAGTMEILLKWNTEKLRFVVEKIE